MSNPILKAGELAYYDSFAGLIPCKVVRVFIERVELSYGNLGSPRAEIVLTAARPGYKRGEAIQAVAHHVVPRRAVRRRNGQFRIMPYSHEVTSNA